MQLGGGEQMRGTQKVNSHINDQSVNIYSTAFYKQTVKDLDLDDKTHERKEGLSQFWSFRHKKTNIHALTPSSNISWLKSRLSLLHCHLDDVGNDCIMRDNNGLTREMSS